MARIQYEATYKDGKYSKAINILIFCSVRLGSFLDGRSNTKQALHYNS